MRYLLIFNRLLVLYKSKTIVKIRRQILCVCVHVHVYKSSLFLFYFYLLFFRSKIVLIFYLLFNYMIIIKLKHTINMERVITCASGNDFFPECIVFYCSFFFFFSISGRNGFLCYPETSTGTIA